MSTRAIKLHVLLGALALLSAPRDARADEQESAGISLADRVRQLVGAPAPKDLPPPTVACGGLASRVEPELPFSPGEELGYDLRIAGVNVGHVETKVGRYRQLDGRRLLTLFGRARTSSFLAIFKRFEGRYETLVDPASLTPTRLRVEAQYGDDRRWERARFGDGNTELVADFLFMGKESQRSFNGGHPLSDVLALLFAARSQRLAEGAELCQEVFGSRWMWRMSARVGETVEVDTPEGERPATLVRAVFHRLPHKDLNPNAPFQRIEMDIAFARDRAQAPLELRIRTDKVNATAKLTRYALSAPTDAAPWAL